tara:strand:+ start:114 stop:320 length:207 start_codon:yes stop_codon:yes gene_type:complete
MPVSRVNSLNGVNYIIINGVPIGVKVYGQTVYISQVETEWLNLELLKVELEKHKCRLDERIEKLEAAY